MKFTYEKIRYTELYSCYLYGRETWSLKLREEPRMMLFETKVLRRIFGPKKDDVTGAWRKLHSEELLTKNPRVIKSRKMRWVRRVAGMGRREVYTGFWWEKPRKIDNLEDPGVDKRIVQDRSSGSGVWEHGLNRSGSDGVDL